MLRISTGAHFEATIPIRSQKATPQNKCGRGQPPRPHRSWFPDLPLSPLGGGMTASARQRSRPERATSAAFAEAGCRSARSRDRASATAATASDPFLFRRTVGEEAANTRATSGAHRALVRRSPTIHPRESSAAAGSAAIIRLVQERPRFRWRHFP